MWDAVQRIQQERPLTAEEVHEIGCYNGARGIWRDKGTTAHLTESSNGVCVGISSRGKYEDEIGEETGTYDAAYLELALRLGLPLASRDQALNAAASQEGDPLLSA